MSASSLSHAERAKRNATPNCTPIQGSMRGGTPLIPVLWQLVMQCCDQSSLFRLARCSRELLGAASHVCAWKMIAPIQLSAETIVLHSERILDGLLRFATTDVAFDFAHGFQLDQTMSIPRVRIARIPFIHSGIGNVGRLLSHPMLATTRTLHLTSLTSRTLPPLVFPPLLETIHLSDIKPSALAGLAVLEHLTHLDLAYGERVLSSYVDVIRACTHIRVLRTPSANKDSLDALCQPGRLCYLRELDVGHTRISESALTCVMHRPPLHTLVLGNQRLGGLTILWNLARNPFADTSQPTQSPLHTLLLVVSTAELDRNYIEQLELPVAELELFVFWYARGARVVFRLPTRRPSEDGARVVFRLPTRRPSEDSGICARVTQLAALYPDRVRVEE